MNQDMPLAKGKAKHTITGTVHLLVKFGSASRASKVQVRAMPADQKDPVKDDDLSSQLPHHQHRPLRVSSKWGLSKSIESHQRAFVVVEEDSEDEHESGKTTPDPNQSASTSSLPVTSSPASPATTTPTKGHTPPSSDDEDHKPAKDGGDIDWNGASKKAKRTSLTKASKLLGLPGGNSGSSTPTSSKTPEPADDVIDWNGSSGSHRPTRGKKTSPKKDDDEIDWNGSKSKSPRPIKPKNDDEIDWNGTPKAAKRTSGLPKKAGSKTTVRTMKIREQIAEVIHLCQAAESNGGIVNDCKKDDEDNLVFALYDPVNKKKSPMTLIIPDSARTGEFLLFTEDGVVELGVQGTLFRAMARVLADYAYQHELKEYQPIFPKDIETTNSDTDSPEPEKRSGRKSGRSGLTDSFQDDFGMDPFAGNSGSTFGDTSSSVLKWTEEYTKLHGKEAFGVYNNGKGSIMLRFAFQPDTILSDLMAEIWLIDNSSPIVIELSTLLGSSKAPTVTLFQSKAKDLNVPAPPAATFGLMWYLQKRLERYLLTNWPPNKDNHLYLEMISHAIDKITTCTKNCVICDTPLAFEMLKPSICDSALCTFSAEQYGLGLDVVAALQHDPDVFDLLICTTSAITQRALSGNTADQKRFAPFPVGIEVTDPKGKIMTFNSGSNPNISAVRDALAALPSVHEMAQYSNSQELKKFLDSKNVMSYPLLRWILTSNRTHLAKLKPDEHIKAVPTPHQYLMLSATPARERIFQERKKQYGSFMAFHGSGFFNWHAILRTGLRNMSGTDLMSTGAIYGAGIYLAPESGTSMGYAQSYQGWNKSSQGKAGEEIRCMALCEVINAGYKASPYYVIPKEEDIVTRYLFIFPTNEATAMNSATLQAASIQLPKTSFDQLHRAKSM